MKMNLLEVKIMLMKLNLFGVIIKRRLIKFNGIRKDKFLLHLKESQFRCNNRQDIYKLLNNFREKPL